MRHIKFFAGFLFVASIIYLNVRNFYDESRVFTHNFYEPNKVTNNLYAVTTGNNSTNKMADQQALAQNSGQKTTNQFLSNTIPVMTRNQTSPTEMRNQQIVMSGSQDDKNAQAKNLNILSLPFSDRTKKIKIMGPIDPSLSSEKGQVYDFLENLNRWYGIIGATPSIQVDSYFKGAIVPALVISYECLSEPDASRIFDLSCVVNGLLDSQIRDAVVQAFKESQNSSQNQDIINALNSGIAKRPRAMDIYEILKVLHFANSMGLIADSEAEGVVQHLKIAENGAYFDDIASAKTIGMASLFVSKSVFSSNQFFANFYYITQAIKKAIAIGELKMESLYGLDDDSLLMSLELSKSEDVLVLLKQFLNPEKNKFDTIESQADSENLMIAGSNVIKFKPPIFALDSVVCTSSQCTFLSALDQDFHSNISQEAFAHDKGIVLKMFL